MSRGGDVVGRIGATRNYPGDGVLVFLFIPNLLPKIGMRRDGYWFVCINDNGDGVVLPRDAEVLAWVEVEVARNAGQGVVGVPCPACGVVSPTAKGRQAVAAAVGMAEGLAGMIKSIGRAAAAVRRVRMRSCEHPEGPAYVVPAITLDALVEGAEKIGKLGA